jgi:peptidoglycan/LPS O-acetylase OafA/YrhL
MNCEEAILTDRMPGLDLLRSLAITWVMLFHSFLVGGLGADWEWASKFGWMGVDLFFVLSGFLIGTQVFKPLADGQGLAFTDFYIRRAFRILPAYWAVLLLYLLLPDLREATAMESWWKFLTFTMNLSIDYVNSPAFSHAWSLCVEEHFYWFLPPVAALLVRRVSSWWFASLCILVVLAGVGLRASIWLHDMAVDPSLVRNWYIEDIYYPTWSRLDGLLCGVILAAWKIFRPTIWSNGRRFANAGLLLGIVVLALSFWLFRDRTGLLGNAVGWPVLSFGLGLLVFASAGRDSVIGRWKVPGASWLASISFSLYLVHKATYHIVQAHWGDQLANRGVFAFVTYATVSLAAGAVLHYAVERPFLRIRDHLPYYRKNALSRATA